MRVLKISDHLPMLPKIKRFFSKRSQTQTGSRQQDKGKDHELPRKMYLSCNVTGCFGFWHDDSPPSAKRLKPLTVTDEFGGLLASKCVNYSTQFKQLFDS